MSPARRRGGRARRPASSGVPAWTSVGGTTSDEHDGAAVEVRAIQPYQAVKAYTCPGCHGSIAAGTGHLVVVPVDEPDDRRHWHRSCWSRRTHRRPR